MLNNTNQGAISLQLSRQVEAKDHCKASSAQAEHRRAVTEGGLTVDLRRLKIAHIIQLFV